MSFTSSLSQEFKKHFSVVIMRWGLVRQNVDPKEFSNFTDAINAWLEWSNSNKLTALDTVLNDILSNFNDLEKLQDEQIAHIDLQLGKLVAATNRRENSFLVSDDSPAPKRGANSLNIAIIDDSEIARITTKAMLDRFNFQVFVYESIFDFEADTQALNNIDIVLLDVIMPDVTETILFDFAKRLRLQDIQIILLSGVDSTDIRLQAVRSDIGGYITKPFDINVLVSNIRWLCDLDVKKPYKVMLLDDQPMVGRFLGSYAKKNDIELSYFSNSQDFFNGLDAGLPDMFLLDIRMPDVSGMEVCKILRQQQRYEYVPIVFLSADNSLDTKLEALKAGADDVIIKDNPPNIIFKQIERRIIRGQQIRTLSVKDSLTGLLNHGQLMSAADSAFKIAARNDSGIAIAMIDIDNFKRVNDEHGHMIGDNVIIGLSQLLKTSVRETDVVGRYGGEEFMVVFHSDDLQGIKEKLDNVRLTFSKLKFKSKDGHFSCTFSCGVATSENVNELREIIQQADQMMYAVKNSGKNGIKVADANKVQHNNG